MTSSFIIVSYRRSNHAVRRSLLEFRCSWTHRHLFLLQFLGKVTNQDDDVAIRHRWGGGLAYVKDRLLLEVVVGEVLHHLRLSLREHKRMLHKQRKPACQSCHLELLTIANSFRISLLLFPSAPRISYLLFSSSVSLPLLFRVSSSSASLLLLPYP